MTNIIVPALGESVSEATVANWLVNEGDAVAMDQPVVELETDKITVEVNAPSAGVISKIVSAKGATIKIGAVLAELTEGAGAAPKKAAAPAKEEAPKTEAPAAPAKAEAPAPAKAEAPAPAKAAALHQSPAVAKMVAETGVNPADISGSGKDGRLTKGDVIAATSAPAAPAPQAAPAAPRATGPREERVPMTKLRQTISRRLKEAQNTAAMLTTFNEIDMTNLIKTRESYKDLFEKKHGVRMGFMSFFAKAAVAALKELPAVNAEINGTDIIYKNYYDIGIAVGTENGLVVPVLRDVDQASIAGIEKAIGDYARKARDGKLTMQDMTGGTFTITNGGVFGSLLSTPIINPPQSAILGMHKTERRPVVVGTGKDERIEIRSMMYVALSYDHRIIDGKEAVTFLVKIKEAMEDPQRLLMEV